MRRLPVDLRACVALAGLALALCLLSGRAAAWSGHVVGLADGDTLTVLREGRESVKIRVYGIDAPEKRQPWGQRARQALGALVFDQPVEIEEVDRDRYGRVVARVQAQGRDVGLEMVRLGHAWVYPRYCRAPICGEMERAQEDALAARVGLWGDPAAIPPWDWRKKGRGAK